MISRLVTPWAIISTARFDNRAVAFLHPDVLMTMKALRIAGAHCLGVLLVTLTADTFAAWPNGVPCPPPTPPPPPVRLHIVRKGNPEEHVSRAVPLACRTNAVSSLSWFGIDRARNVPR